MTATITPPSETEKVVSLPVIDEDYVCKEVLELLGRPPKFYQIITGKVAKNAYRVNVWNAKPKPKSTGVYRHFDDDNYLCPSYQICDSFYVKVSPEGIIASDPPIEKKY